MSTEIRLILDDPEKTMRQLRHAGEVLDFCEPLDEIADQIEAQLKPAAPHMEALAQIGRIVEAYVQAHAEAGRKVLAAFGAIKDLQQDDYVLVPGPVEEQVEPSAVEPTAFGSIVRAGFDEHSDRILWQRGPKAGWNGEDGSYQGFYGALHDPEVLRVGVGGESTDAQIATKEAQHKGWMIGYTEAWNNATNGDLPPHPPLDDAGRPWVGDTTTPEAGVPVEKVREIAVKLGRDAVKVSEGIPMSAFALNNRAADLDDLLPKEPAS